MRTRLAFAALMLLALTAPAVAQGPPTEWILLQNDPNPFCNDPGWTAIRFAVPQAAEVRLEIFTPDTTAVVRTLVHGMLPAGMHEVLWDGKDAAAVRLPPGNHPYVLTAHDSGAGAQLFRGVKIATIACQTPNVPETWGRVKSKHRD